RPALYGRPGLRGPLAQQVRRVRGRQYAGDAARHAVRRSRAARPAGRDGTAAVRAVPRRAARGRAVRRLLRPGRGRGAALGPAGDPMTAFYPVFLDLRGRRAVVIGGGAAAEQKVRGLIAAGAHVTLVSPDVTPALTDLGRRGEIELRRRGYHDGDLAGAWLAIAAVNRTVNAAVWAEAERLGVPLNAVDDLEHSSFIAPAIHREGDITVAVSTGGKSPALAVRLRQRIARLVGRAEARLCALLGELRPELAARVPDARARTALWYAIVDSDVIDFVRRGDIEGARGRIEELIGSHPLSPSPFGRGGTVSLVGAGPGDPGLITAKGLELLRSADVVVYDRLVS